VVVDGFCNYRSWETRIEMMGSSSLLSNAKITYFLTIAIDCAVFRPSEWPIPSITRLHLQ